MSNLTVRRIKPVTGSRDLWSLVIYKGDTKIGEYERSEHQNISRKEREIHAAADFLYGIYQRHGPFEVRWSNAGREKRVRVNGQVVGVIPAHHWR